MRKLLPRLTLFELKDWEGQLWAMWQCRRMDTRDIADVMLVPECEVYNAIHRMREKAKK